MKNFVFSLDRMRRYKGQVLEKEKNNLNRLRKRRDQIEENIVELKIQKEWKNIELAQKQAEGMDGAELSAYGFFFENIRLQMKDLDIQLKTAEVEVERQLQIVIAASKEVASLDKLEEKQLEEYRLLETRDFNVQIQEHVITSMTRKQTDTSYPGIQF